MKAWLALSACAAAALFPVQSVRAADEPSTKNIVVVSIGPTEPQLLKRVSDFLSTELECKVRIAAEQLQLEETPDAEAKALSQLIQPTDACVVALLNVPQDTRFVSGVMASYRVALLNVRYPDALATEDPAAKEKRFRRVEEDSIRSVARLMGFSVCPFKLCALHYEQSTGKEGEIHARNLCPPCQDKARKILKESTAKTPPAGK